MSDEVVEDVSVVETEAPVGGEGVSGGTEPVASAMPVETSAEFVQVDTTVEAMALNTDSAATNSPKNSALVQNAQAVANEVYKGQVTEGAALTSAGAAAKEDEKAEKREQLQASFDDQQKTAERHRAWMESQHNFGGMSMSGHDLDKLMNFYASNPQMMDKLRDRMTKSGMSKDKVDKGVKEFQEFLDLKKKEKDGELSADEQRRLLELQKSEEFKKVAEASVQQARDNGIISQNNDKREVLISRTSNMNEDRAVARDDFALQDKNAQTSNAKNESIFEQSTGMLSAQAKLPTLAISDFDGDVVETKTQLGSTTNKSSFASSDGAETARAHFASAPHLTNEFTSSNVVVAKVVPAANDMSFGDDKAPATIVAEASRPKPAITADVSFG